MQVGQGTRRHHHLHCGELGAEPKRQLSAAHFGGDKINKQDLDLFVKPRYALRLGGVGGLEDHVAKLAQGPVTARGATVRRRA